MTQAVKVYQIAQELGMDTDAVVARIRAFGINVNNKMSKVDGGVAEQIKSSLLRERQQQEWVEVDIGGGIIKRVRRPQPVAAPPPPPPEPVPAQVERVERTERPERTERVEREERVDHGGASAKGSSAESSTAPAASASTPAPEPAAVPEAAPAPTARSVEAAKPEPAQAETPAATESPAPPKAEAKTEAKAETKPEAEKADATPRGKKPAKGAKPEAAPEPAKPEVVAKPEPVKAETPAPVEPVVAKVEAPAPTQTEAPAPAIVHEEKTPPATAAVEAKAPVAEAPPATPAAEPEKAEAPKAPTPSIPPPSERASIPPPKSGISTWDPTTRTVTHNPSPGSMQTGPGGRRVEVDTRRLQGSTAMSGGVRPGVPGARPGGPGMRPGGPGMRAGFRGGMNRGPANVSTKAMGAEKRVVKIEGQISLQQLAGRMSVKSSDVLMTLLKLGMTGVNINSSLDTDTAKIVASEFNYEVDNVAVNIDEALKAILPEFKDNPADHQRRAPVVTVMGHVDHGKTTLLDAVLGMRVAEGEAGGITQKVSAYRVETKKGPVVFFDTPGHEAFTKLRARGAETTDVAVLVVAADDGVMPTTIEAINHVMVADVPIVVALNKMDKPDAKPERVLQELMGHNVVPEEFGGETLVVKVSAKMRQGIDDLLENLALQSEILDLDSNPKAPGHGTVFDATLDKGRGVVTRFLVQDGTVRTGDVVLAGTSFGKIRAMFDDRGKPIAKAGPSSPVEILGLNELPNSGDKIYVVQDLKKAQQFADEHKKKGPSGPGRQMLDINTLLQTNEQLTVGVIIKAEAQGSVEALTEALTKLSTDKVKVQVVHSGVGGITESDVNLAIASNKFPTTVIGFNVRPQGKAQQLADSEKIPVKLYTIIYEAVDDMKALMEGQLKPTMVEKPLGKAEVRQVFNVTKVGTIAGSYVIEGKVARSARARLVRDSVQVWEGKVASLRRFKDDAKEVAQGYECGIGLENYSDIKPNDIIEFFELEEVASKL